MKAVLKSVKFLTLLIGLSLVIAGCGSGISNNQSVPESPSPKTSATDTANEEKSSKSDYPSRPINIIVGFGAGGNTDLVSRFLASSMSETLGVNITVNNMPGGTGGIAADAVNKTTDGYTLLGVPESLRILAVSGYHPTIIGKDWNPLIAAEFDGVISVAKDSPYQDFQQLLDDARKNPDSIKFSASSPGTLWHVQSQIMRTNAGVEMKFIPYQGSHQAQTAAMTGEVSVVHTGLGEQAELIRNGDLRPLVMFSNKPFEMEGIGTIPAITDYLPELNEYLPLASWIGLAIPAAVPDDAKKIIEEAYLEAVQSEEFKNFIDEKYGTVLGYDLEKSLEVGLKEMSTLSWLLYDQGIVNRNPEEFGIPRP